MDKEKKMRINISLEITDEMIEDILCCAFEGGITYWADNVSCEDKEDMKKVGGWKHEYLTKTKKKDAKLIIWTNEEYNGDKYPITKKSIIEALEKMGNPKYKHTKTLGRILDATYDAWDSDAVLQIACFGEVMYG